MRIVLSMIALSAVLAMPAFSRADTVRAADTLASGLSALPVAASNQAPAAEDMGQPAVGAPLAPVPQDKPVFVLAPFNPQFMLEGMTLPRVTLAGHRLHVLSDLDAARYRTLFSAARKADWERMDQVLETVDDSGLRGHILRLKLMHPTGWRAQYDELAAWMRKYNDHPGAKDLHALAEARRTSDGPALAAPNRGRRVSGRIDAYGFSSPRLPAKPGLNSAQKAAIGKYRAAYDKALDDGDLRAAQQVVLQSPLGQLLSDPEQDDIRSDLARELFFDGNYLQAYKLATVAAKRSGSEVPMAHWTAGLSAWAVKEYRAAALHFGAITKSRYASPWMKAAGGFWAARCFEQLKMQPQRVAALHVAAEYPATFYGLLATRALGTKPAFNWNIPALTEARINHLAENPVGRRALMLLQVGETSLAEKELIHLHPGRDTELRNALLAVAEHGRMPNLAMRLGSAYDDDKDRRYDKLLFPLPQWDLAARADDVDQALILAFMRQESRFNPTAESGSGARGLMQVMPSTAAWLMKKPAFENRLKDKLFDPETSIRIGAKYIAHLLGHSGIDDDLVLAVIAYNAGPGNALRWKKQIGASDPLFLIERIPAQETRIFAEKVLSNYWIYRMRLGQETPELNKIARGSRSLYVSQEKQDRTRQVASRNGD